MCECVFVGRTSYIYAMATTDSLQTDLELINHDWHAHILVYTYQPHSEALDDSGGGRGLVTTERACTKISVNYP